MKAILILSLVFVCVACEHKTPKPPQPGEYKDSNGQRSMTITKPDDAQLRVELFLLDSDQFVDITGMPLFMDAKFWQVKGVNRITGTQETLQLFCRENGQIQVLRLNDYFPDTLMFERKQ